VPTRPVFIGIIRYYPGTGCVAFNDDSVVTLTVREEELFDLLRRPPFVTVPWATLSSEMAMTVDSVKQLASGIREKLGPTSIMTHKGIGYRLNPRGIVKQGTHVTADVIPWHAARSG